MYKEYSFGCSCYIMYGLYSQLFCVSLYLYIYWLTLTHVYTKCFFSSSQAQFPFFLVHFQGVVQQQHTVAASIVWLDFQLLFSFSTLYTYLPHCTIACCCMCNIQFIWKRDDDASQQVVVAPLKKVHKQWVKSSKLVWEAVVSHSWSESTNETKKLSDRDIEKSW